MLMHSTLTSLQLYSTILAFTTRLLQPKSIHNILLITPFVQHFNFTNLSQPLVLPLPFMKSHVFFSENPEDLRFLHPQHTGDFKTTFFQMNAVLFPYGHNRQFLFALFLSRYLKFSFSDLNFSKTALVPIPLFSSL